MRRLLFAVIGCVSLSLFAGQGLAQPAGTASDQAAPPAAQSAPAAQPAATQPAPAATSTTPQAAAPAANPPAANAPAAKPVRPDESCGDHCAPPPAWFVYAVIGLIVLAALVAMLIVRASISTSTFSLGEALSEEAEVTATDKDGQPIADNSGKPVTITKLAGSTSRVIALMGSIVLMVLFIGFGSFVLYFFGTGQGVPKGTDEVVRFLVAGLTLFAPYAVNKFSSLFEGLAPRR
jgi:hypothetical protein